MKTPVKSTKAKTNSGDKSKSAASKGKKGLAAAPKTKASKGTALKGVVSFSKILPPGPPDDNHRALVVNGGRLQYCSIDLATGGIDLNDCIDA